jgi:hypothetical protein
MDKEVPENHAAVLRTICGFGEFDELPAKMQTKYWEWKRILQRDNAGVSREHLWMLAFTLGYGKPLERELKTSIVDLWARGKVRREAQVIVQWRNGERSGVLKRVDSQNRCIVQMDGDADERIFEADKVRVAEAVEA